MKRRAGTLGSQDDSDKTRIALAAPAELPPQSPLDFTLAVMRDPLKPDALRAGMAKAALPYVHGRWCPLGSDPRDAKPKLLVPGAAQRETVRRRPGTVTDTVAETVPDQRCTAPRCSASGTRATSAPLSANEDEVHETKEHEAMAHEALEQRALAAEARMHEMEQRALAGEARLRELEAREIAIETMLARVKTQWPDIFDASGAVRAPGAEERDMLARLTEAQERARSLEERAVAAEGRLREAQFRARDMEQRACAAEALIAGRR